jgi:hypothetical protein
MWSSAGFDVMELSSGESVCQLGSVQLLFDDVTEQGGILSTVVRGASGVIDSLKFGESTDCITTDIDALVPSIHPNGITRIDHLVVTTPNCDRTTLAFEGNGIHPRRVRTFGHNEEKMRQSFFWLGDVILELVGPDGTGTKGPAMFWGLALISENLQATADYLGDRCTPIKPAVQAGRKITTIKTRSVSISTSLAVMSPHDEPT